MAQQPPAGLASRVADLAQKDDMRVRIAKGRTASFQGRDDLLLMTEGHVLVGVIERVNGERFGDDHPRTASCALPIIGQMTASE